MGELKLEELYNFNHYQTPLTEQLKDSLPKEVWLDLLDYISNVEIIKRLIAPEEVRGFAKDRPKDENYNNDRIKVDLVNPHILEDMDFFRERALYFQKHGKYTHLTPNPNPKSDYAEFWKEELRKWKYGLVRESDGEWIPGQLYFYWNYSPIWLVEIVGITKDGKKKGERKRKFPKPWLGDYLFYHYMEQGRNSGQHGKLLKTRGVGFLEPNTSLLQQSTGTIRVGDVKVGDMLLDRYGNDTKVLEVYPQGEQELYLVTLKDGRSVRCGLDHLWSVYDKNKGSKNKNRLYTYKTSELLEKGLSWKNKNSNDLYKFYVPDLAEPVKYGEQDLYIPPYVMGALLGDGSMSTKSIKIASDDIEVINKIQSDLGDDYELIKDSSNNNYRIVYKHLYRESGNHIRINPLKRHLVENDWNFTTGFKFIPDVYKYSSYNQRLELVKGLMDTDGSISKNGNLEFSNSNEILIDDLASVLRSMGISCTKGLGRTPHQKEIKGKICNIKQEYRLYIRTNLNLFNISRKSEKVKKKKLFLNNPIVSITKLDYKEESTCFLVDNKEHLYLTGDFVPTHNSFKMGSISPCNMYTLPGSGNPNFHLASEKTFLSGDKGIWGKVLDTLDWIAETTPLPKMRLVDDTRNMNVQLGFKDEYGTRKGIMSSVFGISLKDNPEKARGIRGPLIHYEEDGLFPNLEKAWGVNRKAVEDGDVGFGYMLAGGCLTENNFVWTKNGRNIKIIDLKQSDGIVGYNGETSSLENINWFKEPSKKECLRLTTSGGNFIECSIDHPILSTKAHYRKRINNKVVGKFIEFKRADEFKIGDQLLTIDNLNIFGDKKITDARLLGLAIGDGCYRQGQSVRIACGDSEIIEYLVNKYDCNTNDKKLQKNGKLYCNVGVRGVISIFRNAGIYGDVNEHKKLPINIHEYDKESLSKLLGGYFDADGNVYYNKKRNRIRIVLTCKYKHLLEEVKSQLVKFGIHSNIYKEFRKDGYNSNSEIHRLYITSNKDIERFKNNIPLLCKHKNDNLKKLLNHTSTDRTRLPENHKGYFKYDEKFGKGKYLKQKETLDNFRQESIIKIENVGEQFVYNLNTSITNTYLGNNFITANTGGTEGASFEGSEKLFYNPSAYNIYGIPNVFDRNATGDTLCGFFWGAYLNRNGCYDEEIGEPDVIKALVEILKDRYIVKYNSQDPNAITQKKAEEPITPQEAVMRTEGTLFPVSDLKEYLESIAPIREKFLAEHYVGDLIRNNQGKIEFKPNPDLYPIRSYDKDSNKQGAIEIFEIPKTNGEGEVTRGRYIAGIDPIDADTGTSLFSMHVMDTFTDRIVAEYSGRPRLAEEAYELALRLLEFYNAEANYESNLKGLFSYFDKKNALHRLCDTPQILRDMDYVKATNLYGNKAKGSHASKPLNAWGRKLQADWMLTKAIGDDESEKLNLHTLRSIAYIEEAIKWNSDGNFDRVSAMGMLMILREDRFKRIQTIKDGQYQKHKSLAVDSFFEKNYKKQNAIKNRDIYFNTD